MGINTLLSINRRWKKQAKENETWWLGAPDRKNNTNTQRSYKLSCKGRYNYQQRLRIHFLCILILKRRLMKMLT